MFCNKEARLKVRSVDGKTTLEKYNRHKEETDMDHCLIWGEGSRGLIDARRRKRRIWKKKLGLMLWGKVENWEQNKNWI